MDPIWLAALPAVAALALWAVGDGQRFVLFAVLPALLWQATLVEPGGTQVAAADLLLLVALGGWLIAWSVRAQRGAYVSGNALLVPSLLFVLVNAQSLAWSDRPRDTIIFAIQLTEIVIVFPLLFASLPRSIRLIRRAATLIVLLGVGLAAWTVVEFVPNAAAGDLSGTYFAGLHKNAIGSYLAAGLALAFTFSLQARGGTARTWMVIASLVLAAGLFASVSRGAILGALAAVFVSSLLLRRHRALTVLLVLAAAATTVAVIGPEARSERKEAGGYESSVVRQYSFPNAIEKIRADPLLGTGAGAYQDHIEQLDIGLEDPNNLFLLTWAETGVLGMAALLLLLSAFGRLLWRLRRLPPEAATLGVAAGGVAITFLVHAQVDITWTRGTASLGFAMMGIMLAVERLWREVGEPGEATSLRGPSVSEARARELVGAS